MAPKFRKPQRESAVPDSPESLFDELRGRDRVASLWAHQADVLRSYVADWVNEPDVAIELPTGSGKTLPALLIAEWRRLRFNSRVAYACPTNQLVDQVATAAELQGLSVVKLIGSHTKWPGDSVAKYNNADVIAVTNYSTIFNSSPKLSPPGTIVFDDAHSAEGYVAGNWSLSVSRLSHPGVYHSVLAVLRSQLDGLLLQRLEDEGVDPRSRRSVHMLSPERLRGIATELAAVLSSEADGTELWFPYSILRDHIDRCMVYISWEGILIRPLIPPTHTVDGFAGADQRVYISATLGSGGDIERSFGRGRIAWLPSPRGWDQRSAGRRLFLFPELVPDAESPAAVAREFALEAKKTCIIAPSDGELSSVLESLELPESLTVFGLGKPVEQQIAAFAGTDKGVLALANRYDGIDLADEACRATVLVGTPTGQHMQERFLIEGARSRRVLEERLRTRLVQGAGRSTRGLTDYSLVLVLGSQLTNFFSQRDIRHALRTGIQAELEFGFENSRSKIEDLREIVSSFLSQDEDWRDMAEPVLAEQARASTHVQPEGTGELAAAAPKEVEATDALWSGDYATAARAATEVAELLGSSELQSYRAFWLFLAASWMSAVPGQGADANRYLAQAKEAGKLLPWSRELGGAGTDDAHRRAGPTDEIAIEAAFKSGRCAEKATEWALAKSKLIKKLAQTEYVEYEAGLTLLGEILGARSFKPKGDGRADSVWIFGDGLWITHEAKSEAKGSGEVSLDNVRQTNGHLELLAKDEGVEVPEGSFSVIVTPKDLIHPDAVAIADSHVYRAALDELLQIAQDATDAWDQVRLHLSADDEPSVIRRWFRSFRVLPSDIEERLTRRRLCDG